MASSGAPSRSEATISVWGLSQTLLNELSLLGLIYSLVAKNGIAVEAMD